MRARGATVAGLLGRFDVVVDLLLASLRHHIAYAVAMVEGRTVVDTAGPARARSREHEIR